MAKVCLRTLVLNLMEASTVTVLDETTSRNPKLPETVDGAEEIVSDFLVGNKRGRYVYYEEESVSHAVQCGWVMVSDAPKVIPTDFEPCP